MSFNLGGIFTDISKWISVGVNAAGKIATEAVTAQPVAQTALDNIQTLANIGKDLLQKPDPTAEHIAEVDRIRAELVEQVNALK